MGRLVAIRTIEDSLHSDWYLVSHDLVIFGGIETSESRECCVRTIDPIGDGRGYALSLLFGASPFDLEIFPSAFFSHRLIVLFLLYFFRRNLTMTIWIKR
ncbi:MAG: hypothetical protein CMM01_04090 [Rhodopirellula sp.]|nr:hypothetical protein [Rhodopirellula sp.]